MNYQETIQKGIPLIQEWITSRIGDPENSYTLIENDVVSSCATEGISKDLPT